MDFGALCVGDNKKPPLTVSVANALLTKSALFHMRCFDGTVSGRACNTCSLHAQGRWRHLISDERYHLNASLWKDAGIDGTREHDYGLCDNTDRNRMLYAWEPLRCALQNYTHSSACSTLQQKGIRTRV